MAEMLVTRRANGGLFSEAIGGQPRIPVCSSRNAVSGYRVRNPELLTDLPARLDGLLIERPARRLDEARHAAFFLMSEDAPDA
jgi:hypothetical protein